MERSAFEMLHPLVATVYFVGAAALAMVGIEPHLVTISLVGVVLFSSLTQGVPAALGKIRWQVPLLLLICLINPLISAMGSTLLARVGHIYVYAESLAYGAVMGALLIAVLMWIECAGWVVGPDELMVMGQGFLPTATLMVAMTARLVPQLLHRGNVVRSYLRATTATGQEDDTETGRGLTGRLCAARRPTQLMGILLSWALEDSVERSASMRARGWGAGPRTTYDTHRFRGRDAVALAVVAVLFVASLACVLWALGSWTFYPRMAGGAPWWAYLIYALWALLPSAYLVFGRLRWR